MPEDHEPQSHLEALRKHEEEKRAAARKYESKLVWAIALVIVCVAFAILANLFFSATDGEESARQFLDTLP